MGPIKSCQAIKSLIKIFLKWYSFIEVKSNEYIDLNSESDGRLPSKV